MQRKYAQGPATGNPTGPTRKKAGHRPAFFTAITHLAGAGTRLRFQVPLGLGRQAVVVGLHGGDGGGQERGEQVDFLGAHVFEEVFYTARAGAVGGGLYDVASLNLYGFLAALGAGQVGAGELGLGDGPVTGTQRPAAQATGAWAGSGAGRPTRRPAARLRARR